MSPRLYCVCRKLAGSGRYMIQCNSCEEWFHMSCVGVHIKQKLPKEWFCKACMENGEQQEYPLEGRLADLDGRVSLLQQQQNNKESQEGLSFQSDQLKEQLAIERQQNLNLKETLVLAEESHKIQLQSKDEVIALLSEKLNIKVATAEALTQTDKPNDQHSTLNEKTLGEIVSNKQPKPYDIRYEGSDVQKVPKKMQDAHSLQLNQFCPWPAKAIKIMPKRKGLSLKSLQPTVKATSASQPVLSKDRYDLADEEDFK